jgi:hypothetical protein
MMEIFTIIVLCAAMFGIGVLFGNETSANRPKTNDKPKLDKLDDGELAMLFMAVGFELDRRGMVERLDGNPFDEVGKK